MDATRTSARARPDDLFIIATVEGRIRLIPRWEINRDPARYVLLTANPQEAREAIFGRIAAGLPIEIEASAGAQAEFVRWCMRQGTPIPIDFPWPGRRGEDDDA